MARCDECHAWNRMVETEKSIVQEVEVEAEVVMVVAVVEPAEVA